MLDGAHYVECRRWMRRVIPCVNAVRQRSALKDDDGATDGRKPRSEVFDDGGKGISGCKPAPR